MTDTATPEGAPDASAPLDLRHAHVMSLLGTEPKETETPSVTTPEGEPEEEAQADTPDEGQESDSETEPETDDTEKPQTYRVKVDGAEVEVTLDELQKGYSRLEDYKRKTAAHAEEKRAFETTKATELQRIQEASRHYLDNFQNANQDRTLLDEARTINWEKFAQENPQSYTAARARVEAAHARLQAAETEQARVQQGYIAEQMQKAAESIPEFADEKSRPAYVSKVVNFLSEKGFTQDELAQLHDARTLAVIHDAMQFRELQAKRSEALKGIAEKKVAPKVIDPTRRVASNAQAESKRSLKAQIAKTGDMRERANLLAKFHSLYP